MPVSNVLAEEGRGFYALMGHLVRERLSVVAQTAVQAERTLAATVDYARERRAFGSPIGAFQHIRFLLAELQTEVDVARTFVDRLIVDHTVGECSDVDAAKAKW